MTLSKQFLTLHMAFTTYINTHIYTIKWDHIYNIIKLFTFTAKFIMQYIQKSNFHFLILTTDHIQNSQTYEHYFKHSSICIMADAVKSDVQLLQ